MLSPLIPISIKGNSFLAVAQGKLLEPSFLLPFSHSLSVLSAYPCSSTLQYFFQIPASSHYCPLKPSSLKLPVLPTWQITGVSKGSPLLPFPCPCLFLTAIADGVILQCFSSSVHSFFKPFPTSHLPLK